MKIPINDANLIIKQQQQVIKVQELHKWEKKNV